MLSDSLSYLEADSIRDALTVSSLAPLQFAARASCAVDYASRLRDVNHPLRLLVENEIFRLNVWANPTNESKRGTDHVAMTVVEVWISLDLLFHQLLIVEQ